MNGRVLASSVAVGVTALATSAMMFAITHTPTFTQMAFIRPRR